MNMRAGYLNVSPYLLDLLTSEDDHQVITTPNLIAPINLKFPKTSDHQVITTPYLIGPQNPSNSFESDHHPHK